MSYPPGSRLPASGLLEELKSDRKLRKARLQPALCFLAFDADGLLQELLSSQFDKVVIPVRASFVSEGPLACITHGDEKATIYIHQVLNHPETPLFVIRYILQHELLHLLIPSKDDDPHPTAFCEAEDATCPDMAAAWNWIRIHLGQFIQEDRQKRRVTVRGNWPRIWHYDSATHVSR